MSVPSSYESVPLVPPRAFRGLATDVVTSCVLVTTSAVQPSPEGKAAAWSAYSWIRACLMVIIFVLFVATGDQNVRLNKMRRYYLLIYSYRPKLVIMLCLSVCSLRVWMSSQGGTNYGPTAIHYVRRPMNNDVLGARVA